MSVLSQSTIANKVSLSGIGIHTGSPVNIRILPSQPNSGIIFKRVDLKENNIIVPNFETYVRLHFVQLYQISLELKFLQLNI